MTDALKSLVINCCTNWNRAANSHDSTMKSYKETKKILHVTEVETFILSIQHRISLALNIQDRILNEGLKSDSSASVNNKVLCVQAFCCSKA